MRSPFINRPLIGIFICLAILLAAQCYHLYSSVQLQRIEFNKSINVVLEKTIADNRKLQVTYSQLLKFIKGCINKHKPTKGKGTRFPHIYNFFQTKSNPPEFAIQVGSKEYLADSYLHYVANQLRLRYDLEGTPINIWVDKRRVSAKLDNDDPVDIDEEESENEK